MNAAVPWRVRLAYAAPAFALAVVGMLLHPLALRTLHALVPSGSGLPGLAVALADPIARSV